jgi:hypothetical protein
MEKRTVEIDRFMVKSDSGKEYTLVEYQDYIPIPSSYGGSGEFKGLKRLVTTGGLDVNDYDPVNLVITETHEVVRRPRKNGSR